MPQSATRIGNYAAFLATSTDDFKTAETYFQKALQIDPYHVENLGKYAIFMWDRARLEEANEMFRRVC
jgi:Tfp pilus assembly protein PilF